MILKVELMPSLSGTLTDPGGAFWDGRVADFVASFQGTAYRATDIPRTSLFPSRAVLYLAAPENVMAWQLDSLRRNWSDRLWSVIVSDVRIVPLVPTPATDKATLDAGSLTGLAGAVGAKVAQIVTILAIGGAIALVIYAASKSGGTKQWL